MKFKSVATILLITLLVAFSTTAFAQDHGAIWTSLADGGRVNANLYESKPLVYLNGGPQNANGKGLDDGDYFFQVTDPSGSFLLSEDAIGCRRVTVINGVISGVSAAADSSCVHQNGTQNAGNGSIPVQMIPFKDTTNNGGEYKVWLTPVGSYPAPNTGSCGGTHNVFGFCDSASKTDNFKVKKQTSTTASVLACKFDDSNADGAPTDFNRIPNWAISATGVDAGAATVTDLTGCIAYTVTISGGGSKDVTVTESMPTNWEQTTLIVDDVFQTPAVSAAITVIGGDSRVIWFGNRQKQTTDKVAALVVGKTAAPSYKVTYTWNISKSADTNLIETSNTSATFNYTVNVGHNDGVASNFRVTGQITVSNIGNTDAVGVNVTDEDPNCSVDGGTDLTISPGIDAVLDYHCSYATNPGSFNNLADAAGTYVDGLGDSQSVAADPGSVAIDFANAAVTLVDDNATITDPKAPTSVLPVTLGLADANPSTFSYPYTVNNLALGVCTAVSNTATFTTDDSLSTGSASTNGNACNKRTGALTMGFWQNKNGQALINPSGSSKTAACAVTSFLTSYNPFKDLASTATCSAVASYVTGVIKNASAGGAAMNAMLKGQMLATALDVYFSGTGQIGNVSIGGVNVNLTPYSAAFNGATSGTVSWALGYAAGQSNSGGTVWYGQVKVIQEFAKNAFDDINNERINLQP